mmetsp:Transcript_21448/g.46593  ORF Transcript_21448/g.46593 Transcript_21448/m.46593 type:complete len:341 (+) Transcript_21448:112-1134(+)|eukprot:CAMPEP_0172326282 /NCGR_PEP_ID=MMETSP1058-20130122/56104_1 /TAXON_ID=83371 /ORGANISM="Detonula confervacea, Strain CCMP 353" /LENGTH=340 /DNA_ID=CAMNT_0013043029 /DNA_START=35 /DNA_END=1057 /DNA_ORIENTATION=+
MLLRSNVSLKAFNTFGISVKARYFLEISSAREARDFILSNRYSDVPYLVLGGGSNVLFSTDYHGLILHNKILGIEKESESDTEVWVKAGAGETWQTFVEYCLDRNWGGVENLSLIPGSVGAAPIQNIGAYGVELKDVFHSLDALDMQTGTMNTFTAAQCRFGYRDSSFKKEWKGRFLITAVTLRLQKSPKVNISYGNVAEQLAAENILNPGIRDLSRVICRIRRSKLPDPDRIGNAGSFFKNPFIPRDTFEELKDQWPNISHYLQEDGSVKVPAAWLIDQCGWKGKRFGQYGVHENQPLVLVNYGGATGADIVKLSEEIMVSVSDEFGIDLEREVNIIQS